MCFSVCNNSTYVQELFHVNCCAFYLLVVLFEQEKLHKREKHIHELEMKLRESDRELDAIKFDTEAVCFAYLFLIYIYIYISFQGFVLCLCFHLGMG